MPRMSKVELYAAIQRDHRSGMKIREIERKYNVSWRTVPNAVDSVWPAPRKQLPPRQSALDPYKPVIDGMLRADLDTPRQHPSPRRAGSQGRLIPATTRQPAAWAGRPRGPQSLHPARSLNPPPVKRPLRCLMPAASGPGAPSRA